VTRRQRTLAVDVPAALRFAGDESVPAPYAWLLTNYADGTGNPRYLAGADWPLRDVAEGSARGPSVGFLAKVRLDGTAVWGGPESPREVFTEELPTAPAIVEAGVR